MIGSYTDLFTVSSPVFISNQVPSDLSTSNDGALIVGNFDDLYIGYFGDPVIIVDPYTNANTGLVRIFVEQYVDIAVAHANSFAAVQDLTLS